MSKKNILSLFDGMSCGQIALERAGIKYDNYFASEIDKYAIQITQNNYPNTKQIGNIIDVKGEDLPKIDLLIGGSPCQGFSFAGKQLNFNDSRSALFFEYVRLLKETKPKYFLLENVRMKKEYQDVISECLGVEPVMINSKDFSAQDRKRNYWTNIPITEIYNKNELTVEDILEPQVDSKYYTNPQREVIILEYKIKRRKVGYIGTNFQGNCIYNIYNKSVCLCAEGGGFGGKTGLYMLPCLIPDKFYTFTAQDKHGVLVDNNIRKLTPIECERLQTIPDNYTEGVSNNQRYKMLGNGWTVDVITHILKDLI